MPPLPIVIDIAVIAAVAMGAVLVLVRRRAERPNLSAEEISRRIGATPDRPVFHAPGGEAADHAATMARRAAIGFAAAEAPVPTAMAAPIGLSRPATARRYRLWRDSAATLLVACLVLLAVTSFLPPGQGPGLSTRGSGSAGAVAAAPRQTSAPTPSDVANASPSPTPRATPPLTPVGTPRPTAKPVAKASISMSCVNATTIRFTAVTSGVSVRSYRWSYNGPGPSTARSFSHDYAAGTGGHTVILSVVFTNGQALARSATTRSCG
jgi:hypothetical protein